MAVPDSIVQTQFAFRKVRIVEWMIFRYVQSGGALDLGDDGRLDTGRQLVAFLVDDHVAVWKRESPD